MNWKVFLILLFVFGCDESQKVLQPVKQYVISCEGPDGWVSHETNEHPHQSYGEKSGTWRIVTLKNNIVYSSKCYAVAEMKGNENE